MLHRAVALLAPPLCRLCRAATTPDRLICTSCADRLRASSCGASLRGREFDRAVAAFVHEGAARRLVWALKFEGAAGLATPMAQLMLERTGGIGAGDVIVPAPAHPARKRARGYNQALLLARALARETGAQVDDCLVRSGGGRPQSELRRGERLDLASGAIAIRPRRSQPLAQFPTNVVICDDVMTTTVTLEACAHAIRESPAGPSLRSIRAVTFASASTTRPAHRG